MMEKALKERIIGAVVLVTFVVLIVPIFLDGPPTEGETISERVLLPGQEDQNTKTVVLDRERTEPIPVANSSSAGEEKESVAPSPVVEELVVEQAPKPAQTLPQQAPQTTTDKPQPAASTTGMWAVQLGSFSNKENAEKLAASLRKQGYAAFLSQLQNGDSQLHRVRIGPQKDREAAEEMAARLAKVGHKGQVLPHP